MDDYHVCLSDIIEYHTIIIYYCFELKDIHIFFIKTLLQKHPLKFIKNN